MAKRKIITINEDLCNGCGDCVTACAEGALQIIDGKAKLVKEQYCDGFGDCIGECPTGALKIEEKEVPDYDPTATREFVARTGGAEAVRKFDEAAKVHEMKEKTKMMMGHSHGGGGLPAGGFAKAGGCPGSAMRFNAEKPAVAAQPVGGAGPKQAFPSELNQWPIQIHLVQPGAPFFKNKELVVLSTCAPIASADTHWRFIRGRSVVVGCPKLDRTEGYVEKLAGILSEPSIPKVITVRMEVPCCGGLSAMVHEAAARTGRGDLVVEDVVVGLNGDIG
jgi:ferredoxin